MTGVLAANVEEAFQIMEKGMVPVLVDPEGECLKEYCPDILIQVSAVNAALNSFNKVLLANHIKSCVTTDIRAGKEETVDELVTVLQKLMK